MRKINNNYLGDFYIENFEERSEEDRIKIYDSDYKYLDYLPLEVYDESDPSLEEQYTEYIKMLESFKTVKDLMDWLYICYTFIGSKEEVVTKWNEIYDYCNWKMNNDKDIEDNEWINRIGDVYILITEY